LILFSSVIATLVLGFFAMRVGIDPSLEAMVIKGDEKLDHFQNFLDTFGSDEYIYVAFRSENLFCEKTFQRIARLTDQIQNIAEVDTVTSLTNVNKVFGAGDDLMTGPLVPKIPTNPRSYEILKAQTAADPFYRGNFVNVETNTAAIIVKINDISGDIEYRKRIIDRIEEILDRDLAEHQDQTPTYVAGIPAIKTAIAEAINSDQKIMVPVVLLVTCFFLYFIYRTLQGVLLPLIAILAASLWTAGLMSAFGYSLTITSTMIFPVIIVIGVATSVHIFSQYFEDTHYIDETHPTLLHTLSHMIVPCFLTSLTTAAGFLSLCVARIEPIRQAGLFSAIGVMSVYFLAIAVVPAVLLRLPRPHKKIRGKRPERPLLKFLESLANITTKRGGAVLAVTAILVVLAIVGVTRIKVETNVLKFFPSSETLPGAYGFIEDNLAGITTLDIDISGPRGSFRNPQTLRRLEKLGRELEALPSFDKAFSLADYMRMLKREMNPLDPNADSIPETMTEVDRYLFLYSQTPEGEDLKAYVTDDFSRARLSGRVGSLSSDGILSLVAEVDEITARNFGEPFEFHLTGTTLLYARMIKLLVDAQAKSFSLACLIILLVMGFVLRSFIGGLVVLLPNIIPVLFTYGLLGWLGMPLNVVTAAVASVAIGIAVDDSIHFLMRYQREVDKDGDVQGAIQRTILGTGRAIFYSSVILAAGFLSVVASNFMPSIQFGLLSGFAIVMAMLANLILLPVLLLLFKPKLAIRYHSHEATYDATFLGRARSFLDTVTGRRS
jgi:uncharacterized protein